MGSRTALVADMSRQSAVHTAAILEAGGYEVTIEPDGAAALEACLKRTPEVVVADAVLPRIDGAGLAAGLRRADIQFRPGVVICAYPGFLRCPGMTGVAVTEKPAEEKALMAALESVAVANRAPDASCARSIDARLDELGIPVHPGRKYLADAIFLACEDRRLLSGLTSRLYPLVARRSGTNPAAVERAMRHAIEKAWMQGSIDRQYEMFRETVDAAKGKPTCGATIAQLTELVRMEV